MPTEPTEATDALAWTVGASLPDVLDRAAQADPAALALLDHERRFTFAELSDRSRRTAVAVAQRTDPGDRVAFVGENHVSWVDAYTGVPRARRVLVFANHRQAAPEIRSVVERSGARLLVGPRSELDRIDVGALARPPATLDLDGWEAALTAADPTCLPEVTVAPDDPAWIIYTSGTTGRSKGAVLSHANVLAAVRSADRWRRIAPDDVYLLPFPLCHIAGFNVVHLHAFGRPVVLIPRFDPADFVTAVERHGVTTASLAATMLHSLLDHLAGHPADVARLATLRVVAYGAAPMPTVVLERGRSALGIDFTQGYGMTELAGNAVFLDVEAHRRGLAGDRALLRTAGRPGRDVEVRVVDDDDRDVATGSPGEILVRGPQVMVGYWDDPDATADALRGGWMHTGDVGVLDPDGNLAIVDRKKDIIVTGGENVSSLEVEQVVARVPGIAEVAVVGVPDPRWGENVCAVVVPVAGTSVDPDAVVAAVRSELAGYKSPRHVVVADSLPKNATGKVVKADIRAQLLADPDRLGPRR